ncbi:epoxide hydrolase [Streptomyces olivaceoviridis]|uniref:epoxide hydrolase n=1 Tax=Streptomyces olivaceoviridis TaxID=1921 RepID=UPI0036BB7A71
MGDKRRGQDLGSVLGASGLTRLDLPVGLSVFPHELVRGPKIWAERAYSDLVYFNDRIPYGGHFAAFEQPQLFTQEVRNFARIVKWSMTCGEHTLRVFTTHVGGALRRLRPHSRRPAAPSPRRPAAPAARHPG